MARPDKLEVELVEHSPGAPFTGIGRYTRELYRHLLPHASVRLARQSDPPLTRQWSFLHHLPVGIEAHRPGSIVHFMEDMGCSQMLWRPVRPAIATSHDLGMLLWPPEARMHRALDRVILRLSYLGLKRMDAVVTPSEFSRQTVIQRMRIPSERVYTAWLGLDHRLFQPVADARAQLTARYGLPFSPELKYLLYVGSELPRKNIATILRVLQLLPPHVRLLKAGTAGPKRFREHTKKLVADYELGERVVFLEQVAEEDLALLYSAADIYICASFLEGFGIPVLEAMACGLPVVCSNTGSLPEVVGDAALLVHPDDATAFAEAVERILSDSSLRQQMTARGLQRASIFSWERTAEAVLEVYKHVVSGDRWHLMLAR